MVPNQGEDGAHAGLQLLQVLTGRGGNSATAKEPSTTSEHVTTHYLTTKPKFTQWRRNENAAGDASRPRRPIGSRRAHQQEQERRLIREAVQQVVGRDSSGTSSLSGERNLEDNATPSNSAARNTGTSVGTRGNMDFSAMFVPLVGPFTAIAEAQVLAYMNTPQRRAVMDGKVALMNEKAALQLAELRAKRRRVEANTNTDVENDYNSDLSD